MGSESDKSTNGWTADILHEGGGPAEEDVVREEAQARGDHCAGNNLVAERGGKCSGVSQTDGTTTNDRWRMANAEGVAFAGPGIRGRMTPSWGAAKGEVGPATMEEEEREGRGGISLKAKFEGLCTERQRTRFDGVRPSVLA